MEKYSKNIKAVIMAAGLGTRLKEATKDIPKCLVLAGGKSLLEGQVNTLIDCGFDKEDISIVIGTKGKCWNSENYRRISRICPNMILNEVNDITMNAYSLYLAIKDISDCDVLAMDCDVIFSKKAINKLIKTKYPTAFLCRKANDMEDFNGTPTIIKKDRVINYGRATNVQKKDYPWWLHSGLTKIGKKDLEKFKEELSNAKYHKQALGWPIRELAKKIKLYKVDNDEWLNVNTLEELSYARKLILKHENFNNWR